MKTKIHVNQHNIKHNTKYIDKKPVLTVKTYKSNTLTDEVTIHGPSKVVYSPENPLPCGARVWIETEAKVTCKPLGEAPECMLLLDPVDNLLN